MKDEERLAAQHYDLLSKAIARDYDLTWPITVQKTAILGLETRTRLRFNSLFEIDEFLVALTLIDSTGRKFSAEVEFGVWKSDGVLEIFDSKVSEAVEE